MTPYLASCISPLTPSSCRHHCQNPLRLLAWPGRQLLDAISHQGAVLGDSWFRLFLFPSRKLHRFLFRPFFSLTQRPKRRQPNNVLLTLSARHDTIPAKSSATASDLGAFAWANVIFSHHCCRLLGRFPSRSCSSDSVGPFYPTFWDIMHTSAVAATRGRFDTPVFAWQICLAGIGLYGRPRGQAPEIGTSSFGMGACHGPSNNQGV